MPAPNVLYALLLDWLCAMEVSHRTARAAVAVQVTAVLVAQSLRPAGRMRALLSAVTVPARQRYRRASRALSRASLSPERLTALLVRAVLALAGGRGEVVVALDSVRCGPWELLTLSVVWRSRALPVGWAVLQYPWPRGQFTPTASRLIRQVAQVWPKDRPAHLVADRGFPSLRLFRTLEAVGWRWTVRLQARSLVGVEGGECWVRDLLGRTPEGAWQWYAGSSYGGSRKAVRGHLVVGKPQRTAPPHQRHPSSAYRYERQQARRLQHAATKNPRYPAASSYTVLWLVLFTTTPSAQRALATYRRRWAIEGSYRDAQGGWDGQHGWDLEPTVASQKTPAAVTSLVGLWALGALVQMWVGDQVVHGPAPVRLVTNQWTTTGRLSLWARGRLALTDRSGECTTWLQMTLNRGAQRIATAPVCPPITEHLHEPLPRAA